MNYEPCDDDGMPIGRERTKPKWQTEPTGHSDLRIEAFGATMRRQFGDPREQKDWKKVCRSLDKGEMSEAWVRNCIEWARKKNADTRALAITFVRLETLILNAVKQKEWEAKNMIHIDNGRIEITDGSEIDIVIE